MAINSEEVENNSKEELIRVARERYKIAREAAQKNQDRAREERLFRAGQQWPDEIRSARENESRPCLTVNKTDPYVRQITNDQRQNRPSIKVIAVDDKADVETAEILEGMTRRIQERSGADVAYDTAFEGAVTNGFGYFRIRTDFDDPKSFNQEIIIDPVLDPSSVTIDPFSRKPDGSDMKFCFIESNMSKDAYLAEFGESKLAKSSDWSTLQDFTEGWVEAESVKVAEYFYIEHKKVTIVLLNDGVVFEKKDLPEILPDSVSIEDERETLLPVIKWCKIDGVEILSETEWLGSWIPVIPSYGKMIDINGELILSGLVRDLMDSQRMYNYNTSNEAEAIALAPKAPYIVAEGQIPEQYAGMWETANKFSYSFLPYKPTAIAGIAVPPPQRQTYEPAIQAITQSRMQASEDMKSTSGIQDAAIGALSNEVSGRAIDRRAHQSQTSNFHYVDNLTRSLRHAGRIIVELIPRIYTAAQAIRILGEDGQAEIIRINEIFKYKGKERRIDLGIGKYDVVVETGPSFATKREAAVASMIDFIQAVPQAGPILGDLLAKFSDWPESQVVSDRLKKIAPPGVIEDKAQSPIPPQAKAQMDQMSQMIEQLTAVINEQKQAINTKTMELESKERIELQKIEADLKKEMFKANAQASNLILAEELAEIKQRLSLIGINQPIEPNLNDSGLDEAANQQNMPTDGQSSGQPPFEGEQDVY